MRRMAMGARQNAPRRCSACSGHVSSEGELGFGQANPTPAHPTARRGSALGACLRQPAVRHSSFGPANESTRYLGRAASNLVAGRAGAVMRCARCGLASAAVSARS